MADIYDGSQYLAVDNDVFALDRVAPGSAEPLDILAEAVLRNAEYHLISGIDSASWAPPVASNKFDTTENTRIYCGRQWWSMLPPIPILIQAGQTGLEITGAYSAGGAGMQIDLIIPGVARKRTSLANTNLEVDRFRFDLSFPPVENDTWSVLQMFGQSVQVSDHTIPEAATVAPLSSTLDKATNWTPTPDPPIDNDTQEAHCFELTLGFGGLEALHDGIFLWEPALSSNNFMVISPPWDANRASLNVVEVIMSVVTLLSVSIRPYWEAERQ